MENEFNYQRDKVDVRDIRYTADVYPKTDIVIPKTIDLRPNCPHVYNQGDLGSCTANAGCTCRSMLLNNNQSDLSRLFLYYVERKMKDNVTKDAGASLRDTCKAIHKRGVCEEKYMPYNIDKFAKKPSQEAYHNANKYKITAYKTLGSLDEIKQSLALRMQPVLIGMDVYKSFKSEEVAKTGIMTMPKEGDEKLGGHAVLVVGYKDTVKKCGRVIKHKVKSGYLIVRNSWGSEWGDKGYFYMPYKYVYLKHTFDYWIME